MSQPPPNDLFKAAEQSLSQRDFHKCREYALAVPKSDPRFPGVAQILAVADTLIAGETKVTKAKDPDWYAILQLKRYCSRDSLIADQFKKLYSLLNPDDNRFPLANEAAELTLQAYFVLKDSSTRQEFDDDLLESELPKVHSAFWAVCSFCFDKFAFDNKAYEGGVFKCEKCRRIKPIKPQPKNELGMKWSLCSQCSELILEVGNESITESTSSDDQEPGFICSNCTGNLDEPNTDSFSAYFPGGFDEGCEWIRNVLNSTPTGAMNLTGQENLTGGNESVADHQVHVVEGGEDEDTTWISCPSCSKAYQYSGVGQKRFLICKNLECRRIISYQKEKDVKILMGKGMDAAGKDNAGNVNQGTNVIRKLSNPFPTRVKNYSMGQENLSGGYKSVADHGINVEGVGGENAGAADTVWVSCPHCSFTFKQVGVPQEGLPKCQNAVCGKEFNVLDAMLLYQRKEDKNEEMRKEFNVLDEMLLYLEEEEKKDEMRKFQD